MVKSTYKVAGLINYDFDKQQEGKSKLIYSNLSTAENRHQTIAMFDHFKSMAYRSVKEPFMVGSVNLHPDEHLNAEDLQNVAQSYLERLGLNDCPVFMTYHDDRRHKHLHFIVSRTDVFGNTTNLAGHFYKKEAKEVSNYFNEMYGFKTISRDVEMDLSVNHSEAAVDHYSILRYAQSQTMLDPVLKQIIDGQMNNKMVADNFPKSTVEQLKLKSQPVSYLKKLKEALSTFYQMADSYEEFEQLLGDHNIYIRAISDDKNVDKKIFNYGIEHNQTTKYVHESKLPARYNYSAITKLDQVKSGVLKVYTYNQQKMILKRTLLKTKTESGSLQDFFAKLSRKGVTIDYHYSGSKLNGYRVKLNNATESFLMKASSIDRSLSLTNLSKFYEEQGTIIEAQQVDPPDINEDFSFPSGSIKQPRKDEEEEEDPELRAKRKRKGRKK